MARFKDTRKKTVNGRGQVYAVSLVDDKNTSVLTTYTPNTGERYDNIAYKFYGDSNKWYIIAEANNDVTGNIFPRQNKKLIIPRIK